MRREVTEVFIAEDGTVFDTKAKALEYQRQLGAIQFETNEALVEFLKETDIWKERESKIEDSDIDIFELHMELEDISEKLSTEYKKVLVGKRKINTDIFTVLWESFAEDAAVRYFNKNTPHEFPREKIVKLYWKAVSENHAYGFTDSLYEFSNYIYALNIMLD